MQVNYSLDANIIIERLMEATQLPTAAKLSAELGVPTSVLSGWRKRGIGNYPAIFALCERHAISIDWVITGRGTVDVHRHAERSIIDLAKAIEQRFSVIEAELQQLKNRPES